MTIPKGMTQTKRAVVDLNNLTPEQALLYDFIVDHILTEYTRFYTHGNKAAGLRLRKNTLTLKKFAEGLRKQVRGDLTHEDNTD